MVMMPVPVMGMARHHRARRRGLGLDVLVARVRGHRRGARLRRSVAGGGDGGAGEGGGGRKEDCGVRTWMSGVARRSARDGGLRWAPRAMAASAIEEQRILRASVCGKDWRCRMADGELRGRRCAFIPPWSWTSGYVSP